MNKYKFFIDPLKEEQWINQMQKKSYRLTDISLDFIYKFEKTAEDYVTQVDYQEYMNKSRYEEYISIHEEFGWEHIRGGRFGSMTQVWSKIPDGNDELFSDRESKINYYKRYMEMTSTFAILFLVYSMLFLPDGPGMIFLTPGLWEMQGMEFWRAFLFELPFALMRTLPAILFPIVTVMFFVAYYRMNKAKKELELEN
ncbi:DUF2812 domain-containing protein [Jeotgalicoccus psychrophilus]|uniref:DUF2812 domain-containing protein n=1 Tax=Jeotgalicoccus psychrophilus TaxID=157228 RepID=UPI000403E668|nr:DUF2812 domain-containing protein [Jeotgalicoccus psychrophilus]